MTPARALVLFDIDGTLLRGAGHHHRQALIDGIREIACIETHLNGVSTSGMLDRDLIAHMLRETPGNHDMPAIFEACQRSYVANCALDLAPFLCPGIPGLLAALRDRGAVLGLVSGNLTEIGWKKMELAGVREYFALGAFAEDGATRTLLAQAAHRRAIESRLVTPTARISLIGDHPNDIRAARENGFQAIGVATGLISLEELKTAAPDILVRNVRELDIAKLF